MSDVDILTAGLTESFGLYRERYDGIRPSPTLLSAVPLTPRELQPLRDAVLRLETYNAVRDLWGWSRGKQNVISVDWIIDWITPMYSFRQPPSPSLKEC